MLIAGGAVAFAGQALDSQPRRPPPATAPPPPALTILSPTEPITGQSSIDLVVLRPAGLRADQAYTVRVYVNGTLAMERALPASDSFELRDIPLEPGSNAIAARLVGDGGEGPLSAGTGVVRDDEPPAIRVTQPAERSVVYAATEVLRGRTEPGATLSVSNAATGQEVETNVQGDGRFSAMLDLKLGTNSFVLRTQDAAGNRSSTRIAITRAQSEARLTLEVTPTTISAAELPVAVSMSATLRDEVGRLIDGVEVTFGVSPPDRSTNTYRVNTVDGRARWEDLTILPGDARGVWLVTVSATLPSGVELRENASFSLE